MSKEILGIGSETCPPVLVMGEYQQWKRRMIHFLDMLDGNLMKSIREGPIRPTVTVAAVPKTDTCPELPSYVVEKPVEMFNPEQRARHLVDKRALTLLIMALPNDMYARVDSLTNARDVWLEIEQQMQGGDTALESQKESALNAYEGFKARETESLTESYQRLNAFVNDLRRLGIEKSKYEVNVKFLKNLTPAWQNLAINLQLSRNLGIMGLHDLFSMMVQHEEFITGGKFKNTVDPLALAAVPCAGSISAPIPRPSEDVLRLAPPTSGDLPPIPGYVTEVEHLMMVTSYTTQNDRLSAQVRDQAAQIELLQQRIRELEAVCRSQAQPSKRRHDDPDDSAPGPHEGEVQAAKRLRTDLQSGSGSGSSAPAPGSLAAPSSAPTDFEAAEAPYVDFETEDIPDMGSWRYERIPEGESVQFPQMTDTAQIDAVIPEAAPTDPSEFQIPEAARKILRSLAQSLRVYLKGDDLVKDPDYANLLSALKFPTPEAPRTVHSTDPETDAPTIIQLNWNHSIIFRPFLEETFTRIYQQEKLHAWSRKVYFGISHIKNKRRRTAYVHQRMCNWATHGRQRIRRRFIKVTAMRPYRHGHQLFLEYDVRMYGTGVPRGELQNWTFTEADLDRVHLEDLLTIIKYLQGPILRPEHYRDGTEILKKYVRHAISLARVTDYQLAIESRQPKVNLLRPNLLVPGIDAYTPYLPTRIPEHGVLYLTRKKKERRFMRFGELSRFCDGTLLYVYNGMQSRLLADQVPSRRIIDGKGKLLEAMRLIEKKLKERMMYRRAEAAMQMRARIIGEWEEYLQMSKDNTAAAPAPTGVTITIPCLDAIHDKVSQVATSSSSLQASVDDLKATALPALSTAVNDNSTSTTNFQQIVVQRLDAQETGLRALQEKVAELATVVNSLTTAPPPPPSFTAADRDLLQSLLSSSFINRKLNTDMASLLQRSISTAALQQAPVEGRDSRETIPFIPPPPTGEPTNKGERTRRMKMMMKMMMKTTISSSRRFQPQRPLQGLHNLRGRTPVHLDVNFGSVTGEIIRLMENGPSEQTRAELRRMTFRVTPLNPESIPSKPTRFNPEASSSRTPEIRAPPETICLSSDDEFISDDFSTPASSPRSPPSNSPRSEGENYPDNSAIVNRDGRLDAVIERLESTRVKIPLRTSWDSEFAYLSQEEYNAVVEAQEEHNKKQKEAFLSAQAARRLASDFVEEDAEISADPVLAQKAALKVFNRNAEALSEEVNTELDWCRDRLHLRKHGAAISGIHLSRTRGKRAKTWITVKRSGVKDVQHTLDKLERYNLSEWNEIRSLLPKANRNYRAEVEEVINGLIARIRRTTEIPDDLLQPSSALPQPPVRRSAGASTRRPTPWMPRMVVKPLDLSMLDLSLPPGVSLSEGQVIREPVHGICVSDNSKILRFQRFSELHKAPYEHLVSVLFTAQRDKKNQDNKEIIRTVRAILDHRLAYSNTPVPIVVKTEEFSEDSDS
ncbi:hypothetical protein OSB04_024743 [Centaurea solstitialis]|uniref:Uncharacterized protein n=1 Tax=Centaurea solstitialis TaxID=347529 RepID=A0AA38SYE3_9ASTR|nr:hypothetical protein OSB04_024743 [Centaurea solstitialis]